MNGFHTHPQLCHQNTTLINREILVDQSKDSNLRDSVRPQAVNIFFMNVSENELEEKS